MALGGNLSGDFNLEALKTLKQIIFLRMSGT